MALRLVSTRDQAAFTLTDNGDSWATPSDSRVPWVESSSTNIRLDPGRYKVEALGPKYVTTYSVSPWLATGELAVPTAYLETHESGTRIYAKGGGTIIITRLA